MFRGPVSGLKNGDFHLGFTKEHVRGTERIIGGSERDKKSREEDRERKLATAWVGRMHAEP
jgi:hypothetical protein